MSELYKRYVDVVTFVSKEGATTPLFLVWDGEKYPIEKVTAVENRASVVGGCGIRYTCKIHGQIRHLFLERDRFFIESYHP